MGNDTTNPFGDFDNDWKGAKEAESPMSGDRVPPNTYKLLCVSRNIGKDGQDLVVDHEVIDNRPNGGSLGLKIFLEILEPEKVGEERTKGKVLEHVFWITPKTIPFLKRHVRIITGKELIAAGDLGKITWTGFTVEGVVDDEVYKGWTRSRIQLFNEWDPKNPKKAKGGNGSPPKDASNAAAATTPPAAGGLQF